MCTIEEYSEPTEGISEYARKQMYAVTNKPSAPFTEKEKAQDLEGSDSDPESDDEVTEEVKQ
jgi:hypothetical protein